MDPDHPAEWEAAPTRSVGNRVLAVVLGLVTVAGLGSLVADPAVLEVAPPSEPAPLPTPTIPAAPPPEPLPFLGHTLLIRAEEPVTLTEHPTVTIGDSRFGVAAPGGTAGPTAVVFVCHGEKVTVSERPLDPVHPQALIAAAVKVADDRGCRAEVPIAGRPGPVQATWAVPVLTMMDDAGFVGRMDTRPGRIVARLAPPGTPNFQTVIGGRTEDPLLPTGEATLFTIADGRAVIDGDDVYFQCHRDSVIRVAADTPRLTEWIASLDCRPSAPPFPGRTTSVILTEVKALAERVADDGVVVRDTDVTDNIVRFFVDGPQGSVRLLVTPNVAPWGRNDTLVDLVDGQALQRRDGRMSVRCGNLTLTSDPETQPITASALETLVTAEGCVPQPPGGPRLGYDMAHRTDLADRYVQALNPYMGVLRALQDEAVRFVLVGDMAAAVVGQSPPAVALTLAMDLDPDNMSRGFAVLEDLGFEPRPPVPSQQFADPQARRRWIKAWDLTAVKMRDPLDPRREIEVLIALDVPYDDLAADAEIRDLGRLAVLVTPAVDPGADPLP